MIENPSAAKKKKEKKKSLNRFKKRNLVAGSRVDEAGDEMTRESAKFASYLGGVHMDHLNKWRKTFSDRSM